MVLFTEAKLCEQLAYGYYLVVTFEPVTFQSQVQTFRALSCCKCFNVSVLLCFCSFFYLSVLLV